MPSPAPGIFKAVMIKGDAPAAPKKRAAAENATIIFVFFLLPALLSLLSSDLGHQDIHWYRMVLNRGISLIIAII